MIKIYHYPNCSTCKKALKFLAEQGKSVEQIHIVDQPPSVETLRIALASVDNSIKKLFNVSGQAYRQQDIKSKLIEMSDEQALSCTLKYFTSGAVYS